MTTINYVCNNSRSHLIVDNATKAGFPKAQMSSKFTRMLNIKNREIRLGDLEQNI